MVKNSLQSLLDKFPYFLNKSEGSNFYKVQWVNNENFKILYNDLFKVYESFHLSKNLLIWKEQDQAYDYKINFVANYPNIKSVKITKNDSLIYMETYQEEDNITSFDFTYICEYTINNMIEVNTYKCTNCNNILFTNNPPEECSECVGHNPYTQVKIYKCDDCGEVYFADETPETCTTCNHNTFTEIQAYQCSNCEQISFSDELEETCPNCGIEIITKPVREIYYNDPHVIMNDNSMIFTETLPEEETNNIIEAGEYIPPEEENESFTNPADSTGYVSDDDYLVPIPIIPSDRFIITVETYDEYTLEKGYPENDKTYTEYKNSDKTYDVFDHDYSLDEFGILNNIPRKEYIDVDNRFLYSLTEPPYNDRLTEDDYHYMNRILEYNLRLYATLHLNELKDYDTRTIRKLYYDYKYYFTKIGIKNFDEFKYYVDNPRIFKQEYNPISLEIWKLYGLPATLLNRERLLLKMFDENNHDFDKETGLVDCWYPKTWEHKDKFCDGSTSLGEYFFVEADTIRPTIYQNVKITFKLLNSLSEEITDNYLVDIYYYLEGEACPSIPERRDYDSDTVMISYKLFNDNLDSTHVLRFVAHKEDGTIIGTEELLFNVRNCDDGDWYVSSTGDDETGDGSVDKPFKTLQKALSVVSKALDLIIVKGNLTLSDEASIPVINTDCTIMGCDENASITSNYYREFFHLAGSKNIKIHLVNLTLKSNELVSKINLVEFNNTNKDFYDYETVVIHGGAPVLTATINNTTYYPYDNINIKGLLTNKEEVGLSEKDLTVKLGESCLGTITTDNNGEFDNWININQEYTTTSQTLYLNFNHPDYFENTQEWTFNYKQPITAQVKIGRSLRLTSIGHTAGDTVNFYTIDDEIIGDATADNDGVATLIWTPNWGSYIVYTYAENIGESINAEWSIDTTMKISDLDTTEFVDSITFEDNGEFKLTTKNITKIEDMTGLLLDLTMEDDLCYSETHHSFPEAYDSSRLTSSDLTPYEYEILKQAITDITVNDNGDLILHRADI